MGVKARDPYTAEGVYSPSPLNVAILYEVAKNGAPYAVMNDPDGGFWVHSRRRMIRARQRPSGLRHWEPFPGPSSCRRRLRPSW